ncbi:hypothetical protein XENOCAPTIV_007383, partial [Xenoophorus captivus]
WMIIEGWSNKNEETPQTPTTPPAEGTPQRRGDFTRQEYERRQQLKIMEDLDKVLRQKPTTVRGVKKQRPKTVFRDDSVLSNSPVKGPKLYKEPSFKSNKFIIHNAITRCCLAGKVNEPQKNKIVEEMEKSTANHFLILFRDTSCQFRAVYTMNPETEEMVRLTGNGPRNITPEMVESIYKYSSDRKQFTVIPSKTMSMSVDAFTIPNHFWQKRPGTPKKLSTPK